MSRKHSTTTTRNFKHLIAYQRGEIQALLKEGMPKMRIAQKVGIVRSTLYEEFKRGTVEQMYSDLTKRREYFADTGQLIYEEHRKVCRKPYKVDAASNFLRHIEKVVLEDKISPDAVCGRAKRISSSVFIASPYPSVYRLTRSSICPMRFTMSSVWACSLCTHGLSQGEA